MKDYNDANRKVAILCNHKRTVAAGHEAQMEKMEERIKGLHYQQYRLKQQMLDLDPKIKKKRGAEYFEYPEGIDDDWVKEYQKALVEEQRQKITKKFEKENEKLVAEGEKEMKPKMLEERMDVVKDLEKKYAAEWKAKGKIEAEGKSPTIEKLDGAIDKLDQRIATMKLQSEDRENNKEVALGTSKIVRPFTPLLLHDRMSLLTPWNRTTSIPVLRWYSRRSSTSRSSVSSPRRCGRSLSGRSSQWMRIGSFRRFEGSGSPFLPNFMGSVAGAAPVAHEKPPAVRMVADHGYHLLDKTRPDMCLAGLEARAAIDTPSGMQQEL